MSWIRKVFGTPRPQQVKVDLPKPSPELAAARRRQAQLIDRLNAADREIKAAMDHADEMFTVPPQRERRKHAR